jgi:hypothetical protein
MAKQLDVPFGRIEKTQNQLHRGGFAGTVGPQQTEDFAPPHFEIDIVYRARLWTPPEILEDLGQPSDRDDDFGR